MGCSGDALWSIQLLLEMFGGKGTLLPTMRKKYTVDSFGSFVVSIV